jgi:hypothetical protein
MNRAICLKCVKRHLERQSSLKQGSQDPDSLEFAYKRILLERSEQDHEKGFEAYFNSLCEDECEDEYVPCHQTPYVNESGESTIPELTDYKPLDIMHIWFRAFAIPEKCDYILEQTMSEQKL